MNFSKIICHVGPWSLEQYSFIAKKIGFDAEISILSGHPSCDDSGFFDGYLSKLKSLDSSDFSPTVQEIDIIKRCRLLRALDEKTALLHLRAASESIGYVLDNLKPDLVLSETIDSYIMDVLYFQAKSRNIFFLGLVPTFISGYFRISARGEYVKTRVVSDEETRQVMNILLNKSYKPDFIKNSDSKLLIYAIGRWLRNMAKIPYFSLVRLDSKERYNYHNWATLIVSLDWLHFLPSIFLGNSNWENVIKSHKKPVIYIPLQMIPEATVDYWCDDIEVINYNNYLIKIINYLSNDFVFLVKEHPNVLGYRNPKLYKLLKKINGVVFVPPHINSNYVIDFCDAVLVWTGSVGFEAALRGKPVLTTSIPYYNCGNYFFKINLSTPIDSIFSFIEFISNNPNESSRSSLIKHVLEGSLPGKYIIDGSWSKSNKNHVKFAEEISVNLKEFLSSKLS